MPLSGRSSQDRADARCQERRYSCRGVFAHADKVDLMEAAPESNEAFLGGDLEHLRREPLPSMLMPDSGRAQ